jgi:hypothetical protein
MKKGMYHPSGRSIFSASQVGTLRMLLASLVLLPLTFVSLKKLKAKKIYENKKTHGA